MSGSTLLLGLAFGSVGMGYFVYGKRQQQLPTLLAGLGLCVLPYLVDSVLVMVLAGLVLLALPFLMRE